MSVTDATSDPRCVTDAPDDGRPIATTTEAPMVSAASFRYFPAVHAGAAFGPPPEIDLE